ncbi:hypothetical protein ACWDYJ_27890 [Streptomyces sp. NPDC003042]
MSFGDPNNPYGQQPQAPQGQPGYGYPQQAPQGVPPQGGYAYPQQQGYPAGPVGYPGAGYPGAPVEMPGGAKAARVILFILGGLQVLGGLLVILFGAVFATAFSESSSSSSASDAGTFAGGVIIAVGAFAIGVSLWPILTAAKMSKGRGGVRVSGIVYGSLQVFFSGLSLLVNLATLSSGGQTPVGGAMLSLLLAVVGLGLGIWVIVGLAKSGAYFGRPRY